LNEPLPYAVMACFDPYRNAHNSLFEIVVRRPKVTRLVGWVGVILWDLGTLWDSRANYDDHKHWRLSSEEGSVFKISLSVSGRNWPGSTPLYKNLLVWRWSSLRITRIIVDASIASATPSDCWSLDVLYMESSKLGVTWEYLWPLVGLELGRFLRLDVLSWRPQDILQLVEIWLDG